MIRRRVSSNRTSNRKGKLNHRNVVAEPLSRKKTRYSHYSDGQLINEAKAKADGRTGLNRVDRQMWRELKARRLLEEAFGPRKKTKSKYCGFSDEELMKKARAKADIRRDLIFADGPLHSELVRRGLLEETFGPADKPKCCSLSDEELIKKARAKADGRTALNKADRTLWKELKNRGLLEEAYGPVKKRKRKYEDLSNGKLIKAARAIADGRSRLFKEDVVLYYELLRKGLMEKAFGHPKVKNNSIR